MAGEPSEVGALHPSARRVAEVLRERGVRGPIRQFEASTKSAADAAKALDCEVGAIASCLVFLANAQPVVVLKSGAHRVDTKLLASLVGAAEVRQATPDEVRDATGQPIGGVSPVGWPGEIRVFIDETLRAFERVWAACGTPNAVFATNFDELCHLTKATPAFLHVGA